MTHIALRHGFWMRNSASQFACRRCPFLLPSLPIPLARFAHSSCQVCPFLFPGLPIPLGKFIHFSFLVCLFLLPGCPFILPGLPNILAKILLPGLPIPIDRFAHSSCQVCLFLLPGLPIPLACSLWTEYNGFDQVEGANSTAPRNGVKMN